jgi:hypothetical protein
MGVTSRVTGTVAVAVFAVAVVAGCAKPGTTVAASSSAPSTSNLSPHAVATPAPTPVAEPTEVETIKSPAGKPTKKPTPTPVPDGNDVIGPFGWQTLRLGMSADAADALGMLNPTTEGDGLCAAWPALPITALDQAVVSPTHGVWSIHPKSVDWMHTPEGMHVGWTVAQVDATYPDFDPAHVARATGATVRTPGNRNGLYRMTFESGVLTKIILESRVDVCST